MPATDVLLSFATSPGLSLLFPKLSSQEDFVATPDTPMVPGLGSAPKPPGWNRVSLPVMPKRNPVSELNSVLEAASKFQNLHPGILAGTTSHGLGVTGVLSEMMKTHELSAQRRKPFGYDLLRMSPELPNQVPFVPPFKADVPDPEIFYRKGSERDVLCSRFTFECGQFRHQSQARDFRFQVWFDEESDINGGEVVVELHGSNLRCPFQLRVAVVRRTRKIEAISSARLALGLPPLP